MKRLPEDFHALSFEQKAAHFANNDCSSDDDSGAPQGRVLPPPSQPMPVAATFVDEYCKAPAGLTLLHWRDGWWRWQTSHWVELADRNVRALLYRFTETAVYFDDKRKKQPWAPNRRKVGDLLEALEAICILPGGHDQPAWLDGRHNGPVVSVANGLLDIERQVLIAHTPQYFNVTSVPFDYDSSTPEPKKWFTFLGKLWPSEPEAILALQEWFGYVISGRLDQHKILLMVGPTRGGKGVIARILGALVGRQNVAGPTLHSLGGDFGLAPLIGKSLAVISDARFVGRNGGVVVERLLSISGEDTLTVNVKYKEQWTGKLPCRLHVISNELPRLGDASTAIIGRIVLLLLSNSWLGKEDHGLEPALLAELTGILNWSLDGLRRLAVNNRFTRLPSADEAVIAMRDLASPVAAFVRERCELDPEQEIGRDVLYSTYKAWAEDAGHSRASKETFGRDLRAAHSSIGTKRPRVDGDDRTRVYTGIGLRCDV